MTDRELLKTIRTMIIDAAQKGIERLIFGSVRL